MFLVDSRLLLHSNIQLLAQGHMCGGILQDSWSKGCEFEPCYGQRVVNLRKSLHFACNVDQSDIWYADRRNYTI